MNRTRLVLLLLLAAGCATVPEKKPVAWPAPPDKERIRFVSSFAHTVDLDTSAFTKFTRAVLGGANDVRMRQPMGLALSPDGQRLYVADHGLGLVLVASFELEYLKIFSGDEPLAGPFDVAVDRNGDVYVSASGNGTIVVFDDLGHQKRVLGAGKLERPTGMALDVERRRLYVADSSSRKSENHRVRCFDLEGRHLFDLGPREGAPGKGEADGLFHFPVYVTLDAAGNVLVGDTMNFRVQVFDPEGKFLKKFGTAGDGPGTFSRLKGMAFDSFGNLYTVDGGHSNVQIFNQSFQPLMFFGGFAQKLEYFDVPSCIAIDKAKNRIYVCNQVLSRINVYDLVNTTAEDSGNAPAAPKPLDATPAARIDRR